MDKSRGGPRTAATSKMEWFVIIVNSFQSFTIITKRSILDVAAALDLPLKSLFILELVQITVQFRSSTAAFFSYLV